MVPRRLPPSPACAAARRIVRAANEHARSGDLFIEDDASTFAADVARLANARDPAETLRVLQSTDPTVRKLLGILAGDFALTRKATIGATALAYERWHARVAPGKGAARPADDAGPPSCSEPPTAEDDENLAGSATADSTAPASARGVLLYGRLDAVRRVDLSPVLQAMTTFDRDRLLALREPANASAGADALAARERLMAELRDFIEASALGPAP